MGFDCVSLSTKSDLGVIYRQWLNARDNKRISSDFKTYLLSSQEHLNKLEGLFKDCGHIDGACGDTFVRESIVELKDGRLLCMDPNEAKAYILDLNEVSSSSEKYSLTVIETDDKSLSFAQQMSNLISKISLQLGSEGVTTTKDGKNIDSTFLTELLSGEARTQYYDELGMVDTSETDNTYTSGKLKLIAAKGITDITINEEEQEYYKKAFNAQGVEIEPNGTTFTSGSTAFISNLNNTINELSKYITKGSTATDQDKLNALQIVRKMSTFEYELLEKMNPGFTQAFNTFIGDFQSRTYADRNGNQTGADTTINYQTVMQEKLQGMNSAISYLSSSDRTAIDKYIGCYYNKDGDPKIINAKKYKDLTDDDKKKYTQIDTSNIENYIDDIIEYSKSSTDISTLGEAYWTNLDARYQTAKEAVEQSSTSTAYNAMYDAISQTVTLGVSETTIDGYRQEIKDMKDTATTHPDEVLRKFIDISNTKDGGEIIAALIKDKDVAQTLKSACAVKGKSCILDSKGRDMTGDLYNQEGVLETRKYNAENILNHLQYKVNSFYSTRSDSTSAVDSAKASKEIQKSQYLAEEGDSNDGVQSDTEDSKIATNTAWGLGLGGAGVGALVTIASTLLGQNGWWGLLGVAKASAKLTTLTTLSGGFSIFGVTLIGAGIGAAAGVGISNSIINNNLNKYQDSNGNFDNDKANWVKSLSGFAGAFLGGALTNIHTTGGWSLLALIPAVICGIAATVVHNVA